MATGTGGLLEPTLRRTSYQYEMQAEALARRRSSIELSATGGGENGLQLKSALSALLSALRSGAGRYCDIVVKDPDLTSKLESAFRLTSYILPGRLGGSWQLSELAYCVSNLYGLLNDYIVIKKCPAASSINKHTPSQQMLLWALSLLDCVEVAMEILSEMAFREAGKWGVVFLLQIIRAVLRLLIVFKLRTGLLTTPSVPSPDRKKAQVLVTNPHPPIAEEDEEEREGEGEGDGRPLAWRAPRTGKVIRSIHTDSTVSYSQLQHHLAPPTTAGTPSPLTSLTPSHPHGLTVKQLVAEALYIARPLVHILSMFSFQQKSWKPWLISLLMDIASLHLHGGLRQFTSPRGKSEVVRRRLVLLLYLLRSPFYDKYTKSVLNDFLSFLSSSLPLVHFIADPVQSYLPIWQQVYSYNWMT